MVLGNFYITIEKAGLPGEGRVYKDPNEVLMSYERREITLHTRIALPVSSFKHKIFPDKYMDKYLVTTPGKILFNEIFPDTFQYIAEGSSENIEKVTPKKFFIDKGENIPEVIKSMPTVDAFAKGVLSKLIAQIYKRYQTTETSVMLDKLKDLGLKYSTLSGIFSPLLMKYFLGVTFSIFSVLPSLMNWKVSGNISLNKILPGVVTKYLSK